jgi:hypothetical protein
MSTAPQPRVPRDDWTADDWPAEYFRSDNVAVERLERIRLIAEASLALLQAATRLKWREPRC